MSPHPVSLRLSSKLVKRAAASTAGLTPGTPGGLAARLRDSGVPASVAYIAFWPGGKLNLKLEALMVGVEGGGRAGGLEG